MKNFIEKIISSALTFKIIATITVIYILYLIAVVATKENEISQNLKKNEAKDSLKIFKKEDKKVVQEAEKDSIAIAIANKVNPEQATPFEGSPNYKKEAKDSTKIRVLITGDSMGDGLYIALLKKRKVNNLAIKYVPWYGSNTAMWGKVSKLEELIEANDPQLVIFTLGSNELFVPAINKREKYVQEIIRQMGDVKYVWVGPPNWKEDTGINNLIAKHVDENHFFISKSLKFERAKDGAHPTFKACETWADTLTNWLNKKYQYDFKRIKEKI